MTDYFDCEWFNDPSESSGRFSRPDLKPFPLARTAEEPAVSGDHVLFTHPATWLRDIDPHCREAGVLGPAAEGRDQQRYGVRLGPRIPLANVAFAIHDRFYEVRNIRFTFNGVDLQGFTDASFIA